MSDSADSRSDQSAGTPVGRAPEITASYRGPDDGREPAGEDADDLGFLLPAGNDGAIGRLGHYEVLEVLGSGGFGTVFRASDEKLGRVVAIKVLSARLAATSPARKRFAREARAAAAVRDPHVVGIHAVEEHPVPYLLIRR